jgi:hypothetical protein
MQIQARNHVGPGGMSGLDKHMLLWKEGSSNVGLFINLPNLP